MLKHIIADYLQISVHQAAALMVLFGEEGGWKTQHNISTQTDVITCLHEYSNSHWFQGHDRSRLQDKEITHANIDYFTLFKQMGFIESAHDYVLTHPPDVSVMLGTSEEDLLARIESLKEDLRAGYVPREHLIFGLGSNRILGTFVCDGEQVSKQKLQALNLEQTEMCMVNLLMQESLDSLIDENDRFSELSYQAINTNTSNQIKERVKTRDTAFGLKNAIDSHSRFVIKDKPLYVAVYSNQPYILRQQRDVQLVLGADYIVKGVGPALTRADFDLNPKGRSEVLGEIARLIYINFRPEYLKRFDMLLTADEIEEIRSF